MLPKKVKLDKYHLIIIDLPIIVVLFTGNRDLLVMFRYLNTSGTGSLTIEEFYGIYDAVMMTWQPQALDTPWYFTASPTVQRICQTANSIISWPYFDHIFCKKIKYI